MSNAGSNGLGRALAKLDSLDPLQARGRVTDFSGMVIRATCEGIRAGDQVRILRDPLPPLPAEVVGFSQQRVLLMPLSTTEGIGPQSLVERTGSRFQIRCGSDLLGRVLDGLGNPLDQGPTLTGGPWDVDRPPPDPLSRPRISQPFAMGLRAIDGLLTMGQGQRIGLFSGSGVGKSTLLAQCARNCEADTIVICLVGERGREVREFIEDSLGEKGLRRSVVVCATSDTPPMVRLRSAAVATAVAEYFRDQGQRVLLLMDSVTRFARAQREVALAAGEPPARRGYPPSVFAALPRLLERAGPAPLGTITAIYTVLVEGGDMEEPIADEVRGILDGHIVLTRELAERGHWPAIDILASLSRVMPRVVSRQQIRAAELLRARLATYERRRDLIALGAYKEGSDPDTDRAVACMPSIEAFLRQPLHEAPSLTEVQQQLMRLLQTD